MQQGTFKNHGEERYEAHFSTWSKNAAYIMRTEEYKNINIFGK
jgi:hypothetical protein